MAERKQRKADKAEVARRCEQITDWLVEGIPHAKIVKKSENMWGIHQTQVYNYFKKVYERIRDERNENEHHRRYLMRYRLLDKAMEKEDYYLALRIIQDLDKLEGYYVETTTDIGHITVDFDFEIVDGRDGASQGKLSSA
jgi:hypothetical protein